MKRALVVIGLLIVVVIAFLWRREHATSSETANARASATANARGTDPTRVAGEGRAMRGAKLPGGFADAGAPERRIAGHVTFDGKPFAGATVRLSAWGGMVIPADPERTSGSDGAFDFGLRAPGWFEVAAIAPDKVAAIVRTRLANPNEKPAPDQLVLVLTACDARIVGTVRDASGGPIVRARVRRDGVAGVETDDTGAYELCVPSGETSIEVSADGYGAVQLTFAVDLRTRRDVVLVPEAVVQGIAVDESGKPVADAYIVANPMEWGPERAAQRSAVTGEDGRFRIEQVMVGRIRLWGFADGLSNGDTVESFANVGVSPDVTITLFHRASITGRLVQRGVPVVGAEVVAVRKSPAGRTTAGFSQADGSFALARVAPGDYIFTTNRHRVVSPTELHVDTKSIDGVVVEVDDMASIKGRVTRNGKPVEGTKVCCVQRPSGRDVTSDANGDYAFEGVEAGSYQLFAQNDRVGAFTFEKPPVVVAAGEAKRVDFDLKYAAVITGTVVDESGAPLRGVAVRFRNPTDEDSCRGVTDESGRYRCPSMTGGSKYTGAVFASVASERPMPTPPGKPYPVIDVKDGSSLIENVTITVVHRRGEIRGRVVDTKGAPVVDAQVKANTEDRFNSWLSLPSTVTDSDGAFVLRELADATYVVQARGIDGGTGTSPKVAINDAPTTIVVTRPGAIEGALVGFPPSPIIYAVPTTPFAEQTMGMVSGSTFRIGGLKPGRYVVNIQTTFEGDIREVEVRSGETVKVDFTSKGRATIEATVNDFVTKAPVPGVQCHVVLAVNGVQGLTNWDPAAAPRSDASGRLRLDPAPAGNVIVACQDLVGRRSSPSAELVVARGATAKLQLWSVEMKTQNWLFTGLVFDWRVVSPRIAIVVPASPAADVGLSVGDLVVAVDDKPVGTLDGNGVLYWILDHAPGAKVPITVQRGDRKLRVEVTLEQQP